MDPPSSTTTYCPSSIPPCSWAQPDALPLRKQEARPPGGSSGQDSGRMVTAAISKTSQANVLDDWANVYWDASPSHNWRSNTFHEDFDIAQKDPAVVFGAEDVDDKWNLLHWASYCGSHKVQRLLMMKGANPDRIKGITTYVPPVSDSAGVSEYTDGGESRPFVPASLIIGEDEVAEPEEIAPPEFHRLRVAECEGFKEMLA